MKPEPTQTSFIYEQIRAEIMNGTLPANYKLKTRVLAERFNVGLSPIREALSRLSSEGWVVQSDRRGFSVVPVSIEDLWDLHRTRCMVNEIGLRESIIHGDVGWEEHIKLSLFRLSRLTRPSDTKDTESMDGWTANHRDFHASLVAACRSKRLMRYGAQLFDEIERYRRLGLAHGLSRGTVSDEHKDIADAAIARDTASAVHLLNAHYTRTVEQVDAALRATEEQD